MKMPLPLRMGMRVLKARASPGLFKLNLAVTQRCNSHCRTCRIWENPTRREDELTIEEIARLAATAPRSLFWLAITGGEPFLRDDLVNLVSTTLCSAPQIGIVSIPTNGTLTSQVVNAAEQLAVKHSDTEFFFQVSIDGRVATHQAIRGTNLEVTEKTFSALRALQQEHHNIHLKTEFNISKFNHREMWECFTYRKACGLQTVLTLAHQGEFYHNRGEETLVPPEIRLEIAESLRSIARTMRLWHPEDVLMRMYLHGMVRYLATGCFPLRQCLAGSHSLYVGATGEVSTCISVGSAGVNVRALGCDLGWVLTSEGLEKGRQAAWRLDCPHCWTPCEAFNSLLFAPIHSLIPLLRLPSPKKHFEDPTKRRTITRKGKSL